MTVMDRAAAIAELKDMVEASAAPELGDEQIDAILDRSALTDSAGNPATNVAVDVAEWTAETAVLADAVIVVDDRFWRCSIGGTTDATEPTWPDLAGLPINDTVTVADGTVTWVDNGTEWSPGWNLDRAAMLGWERKAAAAAAGYDFRTEDQQFARSQISSACRAQADMYRARLGSVR